MHVPQLGLQHTAPVSQVLGPHGVLTGEELMPHTACEHFCPGSTQVPQLALQHTLPPVHAALPHGTSADAAGGVAELGPALPEALALAVTVGPTKGNGGPPPDATLGGAALGALGAIITITGDDAGGGSGAGGAGACETTLGGTLCLGSAATGLVSCGATEAGISGSVQPMRCSRSACDSRAIGAYRSRCCARVRAAMSAITAAKRARQIATLNQVRVLLLA
jgi:hypothetical protein